MSGTARRSCLRRWVVVLWVAGAGALTSCAANGEGDVSSVAEQLLFAASQGQGTTACALLAPGAVQELEDVSGRSCEQAVLEQGLGTPGEPIRVEVFDTMAQVRFDGDTVFLSRFDGAWLVTAAACRPEPRRPYDCGIQVS